MELIKDIEKDSFGITAKMWFPLEQKYISVSLEDATEVTEYHRKAIESLQVIDENLRLHLQNALYKACDSFKYACGLDEPVVENEEDIWNFVYCYQIRLGREFLTDHYSHLIIEIAVSWDDEHAYEAAISHYKKLDYLGGFLCYPANSYADITADEGNYALR